MSYRYTIEQTDNKGFILTHNHNYIHKTEAYTNFGQVINRIAVLMNEVEIGEKLEFKKVREFSTEEKCE